MLNGTLHLGSKQKRKTESTCANREKKLPDLLVQWRSAIMIFFVFILQGASTNEANNVHLEKTARIRCILYATILLADEEMLFSHEEPD